MSSRILAGLTAAALAGIFSGMTFAQEPATAPAADAPKEMAENPQFAMWAGYKAGTTVKYKSTIIAGERNTTNEVTNTLKESTAEKVVIEMKTATTIPGMDRQVENSLKMDVPAKIAKELLPENSSSNKLIGKGDEEIKVADKICKCEWKEYETTTEINGQKTVSKSRIWTCKEVPGGLVKMEAVTIGADSKAASEVKMTLVEFKAAP
ncbi:MAG: hypothetical protein HZA50_10990 [Planctomycetes bacterium]|nr:hypothetical protein [Planctomycetota bacterium]